MCNTSGETLGKTWGKHVRRLVNRRANMCNTLGGHAQVKCRAKNVSSEGECRTWCPLPPRRAHAGYEKPAERSRPPPRALRWRRHSPTWSSSPFMTWQPAPSRRRTAGPVYSTSLFDKLRFMAEVCVSDAAEAGRTYPSTCSASEDVRIWGARFGPRTRRVCSTDWGARGADLGENGVRAEHKPCVAGARTSPVHQLFGPMSDQSVLPKLALWQVG